MLVKIDVKDNERLFTADVISMYTNIDTPEALRTIQIQYQ